MKVIRVMIKMVGELIDTIFDVLKNTISVFLVLGYIIMFIWSLVTTLTGWYFVGLEESAKGFIVLCLCLGIILHIGKKSKRSDDIGGESNQENDTGLRKDS